MHYLTIYDNILFALTKSLVSVNIVNARCLVTIVGAYYVEGPPVPIPNTEVKLIGAENTWRATARENRSALTFKNQPPNRAVVFLRFY